MPVFASLSGNLRHCKVDLLLCKPVGETGIRQINEINAALFFRRTQRWMHQECGESGAGAQGAQVKAVDARDECGDEMNTVTLPG